MKTQETSRVAVPLSLIRVVSSAYDTADEAIDALACVSVIPGYVFGYVDAKERRTVTLHEDTTPDSPLPVNKGLARVSARAALT